MKNFYCYSGNFLKMYVSGNRLIYQEHPGKNLPEIKVMSPNDAREAEPTKTETAGDNKKRDIQPKIKTIRERVAGLIKAKLPHDEDEKSYIVHELNYLLGLDIGKESNIREIFLEGDDIVIKTYRQWTSAVEETINKLIPTDPTYEATVDRIGAMDTIIRIRPDGTFVVEEIVQESDRPILRLFGIAPDKMVVVRHTSFDSRTGKTHYILEEGQKYPN